MEKRSMWKKFKTEYFGRTLALVCGIFIIVITLAIIVFIASRGLNTFTKDHFSFVKFLFSTTWKPDAETNPQYGVFIFAAGSILVSVGAVILSTPVSIALAIFMNTISPKLGMKILQPTMELFVGIPSVVYGWIGISVLVPLLRRSFGGVGFSLLAGILVLSIMILPTITSISSDAIKSVPKDYLEASYGLGATRWQTIKKVIVPASKSGVLTGVVLGLARAFGEALAVQMVIGNAIILPKGIMSSTSTLTSILTMDMANTSFNTPWNNALWSMALLLLVVSFIFILIIRTIGKRGQM